VTSRRALRRRLARMYKRAAQRLRPRAETTSALFVVGAQRSGTTLLLDALDAHPDTRVHHERDRGAFDERWRLRPLAQRRRILERARCRWVVWKPLLDFQYTDELLDVHPRSRAIFVLRDPRDAALSAFEKWGDAMLRGVRRLAAEDPCTHWMAERLPATRREELAALVHPGLDGVSAAALRWWLRNTLFFDLALDTRPEQVLPVRYETLALEPEATLAELFAFLELAPAPRAHAIVSDAPVGRGLDVVLDPAVAERCRALEERLDAVIAAWRRA